MNASVRAAGHTVARRRGPRVLVAATAVVTASLSLAIAAILLGRQDAWTSVGIPIGIFVVVALMRPFEPAPGEKFSLGAAVTFFAALVLPPAEAALVVIAAALTTKVAERHSILNTLVNVSQIAGATAAASVVARVMPIPHLGGLAAAGAAYAAITLGAVGAMVLASSGARAAVGFLRREALPTVALVSLGAIGALLWRHDVLSILLLAIPLALIELGLRRVATERAALVALREALAAQRRFTDDAAHELRTPLTALIGDLAFVERAGLEPTEREALDSAERTAASILVLTERLLALSRAEAPGERDDGDLAAAARDVAARAAPRAGVLVRYAGPERLDVAISPELLTAVAADVVTNAVAYTERGSIVVSVEASGGEAVLIVGDTGIGMTAEELGRAFDRFYRGPRARALASGSGLGLAIVRGIAQAHGGSVTVTSRPDHGTTVVVRMPLASTARAGATARERA